MYFPWFDDIGSSIAADFLVRWPSLESLQRARSLTIERFFLDHNSRNMERIRERLDQIGKATAATNDAAVVICCSAAVVAWAGLLRPHFCKRSKSMTNGSTDWHVSIPTML
jgi:hypothetical protein